MRLIAADCVTDPFTALKKLNLIELPSRTVILSKCVATVERVETSGACTQGATGRREGKRHIRAAHMTFRRCRTDQRTAGRAKARALRFRLRMKHRGELAAPAIQLVAPSNRKGHGVSFMEGQVRWHYLPMTDAEYEQALGEVDGQCAAVSSKH